jgi:hypothetical protein
VTVPIIFNIQTNLNDITCESFVCLSTRFAGNRESYLHKNMSNISHCMCTTQTNRLSSRATLLSNICPSRWFVVTRYTTDIYFNCYSFDPRWTNAMTVMSTSCQSLDGTTLVLLSADWFFFMAIILALRWILYRYLSKHNNRYQDMSFLFLRILSSLPINEALQLWPLCLFTWDYARVFQHDRYNEVVFKYWIMHASISRPIIWWIKHNYDKTQTDKQIDQSIFMLKCTSTMDIFLLLM